MLDSEPIFKSSDLQIIAWLADYYHHPIGEVFDSFCPPSLRKAIKNEPLIIDNEISYKANIEDQSFELNAEQLSCINKLESLDGFDPCLLYGVTGSGKTEIYLQIAATYLSLIHI